MNCVRCHSGLTEEWYEGVEIDRCGKCSGAWLDARELGKIVKAMDAKFSQDLISKTVASRAKGIPKEEKASDESCPKCSIAMTAVNFGYESGVILDSCPAGHGIWLDGDELEKIQVFSERGKEELSANHEKWHQIARDAKASTSSEASGFLSPSIGQFLSSWRRSLKR